MNKTYYVLLAVLVVIIGISSNLKDHSTEVNYSNLHNPQVIGQTDYGTVIKSGPYGNPNSTKKIAFVIGVHPLEDNSHMATSQSFLDLSKSLKCSYYLYIVDVTKDRISYNNGRMNGQLLAKKFIVEDIKKNNFDLVIDIHANRGVYKEKRFIVVPVNDNKSLSIAFKIRDKLPWLVYYIPPKEKGPSSPNYVTVPLIKSGIPAIVYETYKYEPYYLTVKNIKDFIWTVDNC